jgi:hypothetical protein
MTAGHGARRSTAHRQGALEEPLRLPVLPLVSIRDRVRSSGDRSGVYWTQGRYSEAEALYKRAFKYREAEDLLKRASRLSGTARPSAFAVFRLITNSNLADCLTGRSAALSP